MRSNIERKMRAKALLEKSKIKPTGKSRIPKPKVKPPVDLNKPVENPALKKSISLFVKAPSFSKEASLKKNLKSSNFLIPILGDEIKRTPISKDGQCTIQEGSKIKFLNCFDDKGQCFLPAFADWDEIKKWTSEEVSTLVMPSNDLWDFVLNGNQYVGTVINPAGDFISLLKENITELKK